MNQLHSDYDSYGIEEPSDEEPVHSSSEDELDVLLHGTPKQKRKLIRECLTGESESSSEDEFEKEMAKELSNTMKTMEGTWQSSVSGATTSAESKPQQYYDDVYFDSDSEDESKESKSKRGAKQRPKGKHPVLTNDDLLYDPDEDDRDQEWVDSRRRGYRNMRKQVQTSSRQSKTQEMSNSDAILNCPACMTTLCLDCQRHESYKTQYRAMFVMNCSVMKDEVLRFPDQPLKKSRRRDHKKVKLPPADAASQEGEAYHPVKCTECSTEVAVYDKEDVYHFFNVLASHC
ncbi:E2F-associated phosphoprotein [Spea bombifrons]|uniref:E2F-associated phosphoprotein n=1 Tax=Spea bombifrons TaxID=233779 RepID=UPI00234B7849|nr:E2F-associated phosphoprotein [Spea bombifrons]